MEHPDYQLLNHNETTVRDEQSLAPDVRKTNASLHPPNRFLFLHLKHKITPVNVCSLLLLNFTTYFVIEILILFIVYLISDKRYYDVPRHEIASTLGDCAFYSEIAVILFDFGLGVIFDTVGRKIPTVVGLIVSGVCLILMPFAGKSVYPFFLILRYAETHNWLG